jgi:hypothetical protein
MSDLDTPRTTGLVDEPEDDSFRLAAIPLSPERFTTWRERLAQWRALRDAPLHHEDPRIRAARLAERQARRRIRVHHATQYGHIFSNRRIPRDSSAAGLGRYEADLIAVTARRVVLVEVKNWSGQLRVAGDGWVQVQRMGAEVHHPNLLAHNREKLRALHRHLVECGVHIDPQRFHQGVVFVNPRLDIDAEIAGHPGVLQLHSMGDLLGEGTSLGRRAAARVAQWLASAETSFALARHLLQVIPPADVKAAAETIGALRTWDRLTLRGGRELQGDIVWLRVAGKQVPAQALKPGGAAVLHWRRGLIGGVQWVVMNQRAGMMIGDLFWDQHRVPGRRVWLDTEDCVYFHEPGKSKPGIIALNQAERVQIG